MAGAATVFLEQGYEATAMTQIAKQVGVTKPTLYGYFPSKEELFLQVMKKVATELLAASFEKLAPGDDLEQTLLTFGEHFLQNMLQPDLITLRGIIMTEGRRSGIGAMLFEQGLALEIAKLAAFLAAEMGAGQLRNARPETAAAHLLGMLESEYQQNLLGATSEQPPEASIKQSVRDAVSVFLRGYAPAT